MSWASEELWDRQRRPVQIATGYIVEWTHSYLPLFIFAGLGYLVALAVIHALSPRLAPVDLD